jgi:hypothetical protein
MAYTSIPLAGEVPRCAPSKTAGVIVRAWLILQLAFHPNLGFPLNFGFRFT